MAAPKLFSTRGSCLLVLLLFSLIQAAHGQTVQGEVDTGTTSGPSVAVIPGEGTEGTCRCSVNSPAVVLCTDYQTRDNAQKLQDIQHQISNLTRDVNDLYAVSNRHSQLIAAYENNLLEITSTFEMIEGGQLLVTRALIEDVRSRIQSMESALYALREWHGLESDTARAGKIQLIMNEVLNISQIVDAVVSQDTSENVASMRREIVTLGNQLKICSSSQQAAAGGGDAEAATTVGLPEPERLLPTTTVPTVGSTADAESRDNIPKEGNLPERWPARKKQNSCGRLLRIEEPYTVRGGLGSTAGAGTWMRDPLANPDFVYFQRFTDSNSNYNSNSNSNLKGSRSVKSFQRSETHEITGQTDMSIEESVVYNGSLFAYSSQSSYRGFQTQSEKRLSKIKWSKTQPFAFVSEDLITKRRLTSSDDRMDQFGYSAAAVVPKMDLTLDESGLWVLYGDAQGMLTASRVDPETLELSETWEGSFPKNLLANCFIVCGRVYCVNSSSSFNSRISYYMDTGSGIEGFANIPFMIKYGSLSSIEYNPNDQLLYGVDGGLAVIYPLIFEE